MSFHASFPEGCAKCSSSWEFRGESMRDAAAATHGREELKQAVLFQFPFQCLARSAEAREIRCAKNKLRIEAALREGRITAHCNIGKCFLKSGEQVSNIAFGPRDAD